MKRFSIFTTALLIVALAATVLFAQPGPRNRDDCDGPMFNRGMKGIPNLTADQKTQIEKLRVAHQKDILPLKTKLKAARLDMQSLQLEEADQKAIDNKIEEIGKIKIELAKKMSAHHAAMRNLLTDEQKEALDQQRMNGRGHRPEGKRMRGHRGMDRPMPDCPNKM